MKRGTWAKIPLDLPRQRQCYFRLTMAKFWGALWVRTRRFTRVAPKIQPTFQSIQRTDSNGRVFHISSDTTPYVCCTCCETRTPADQPMFSSYSCSCTVTYHTCRTYVVPKYCTYHSPVVRIADVTHLEDVTTTLTVNTVVLRMSGLSK